MAHTIKLSTGGARILFRHLSILLAVLTLPSCGAIKAVSDTGKDVLGIPDSRLASPGVSDTNIYDVEINESTLDYLQRRREQR